MQRALPRWRGIWAAVLPSALAILSPIAALDLAAPESGPVAAVFPPWWENARIVQAAATVGRVAGFGRAPFVIIVVPDSGSAGARLRTAGALLLLDPLSVGGCAAATAASKVI